MQKKQNKKVLVFIPTFNFGKGLKQQIADIKTQKGSYQIEILIIDSSIKEVDIDSIREIEGVHVQRIPNKEFSHGGTRQKAIEYAIKRGAEYIVFTVQDAKVFDKNWVKNMIEPYELDDKIACVFGNQVPYPEHNPLSKKWIVDAFDSFSPTGKVVIHDLKRKDDPGVYFNSHVNSSYKLSFFKNKTLKIKNVNYAEDQFIAKEIIDQGLKKAYNPDAKVYHSHAWKTPFEYFQRFFDEYRGLHESIGYVDEDINPKRIVKYTFIYGKQDAIGLLRSKGNFLSRLKWGLLSFPINFYKYLAIYLGRIYKDIPQETQSRISREDMQKNLNKTRLGLRDKLVVQKFIVTLFLKSFKKSI